MLREALLIALFEECTAQYKSLREAIMDTRFNYLTSDEADCLHEMLESWYE